jgi:ribosomal protein S18 acetylase RimI-like enzyme
VVEVGRGTGLKDELYARGMATVVASWGEYARGAPGASVQRLPGVSAAVFPEGPERAVYNNAVLERPEAVGAMEAAYAEAGIGAFAAWTHETDAPVRSELEGRGYAVVETTLAMGMALEAATAPRPDVELAPASWTAYLRLGDLPSGILAGVDPNAFHVVVGCLEGAAVAAGIAYDHDGDCGIFNVATLEGARRRGIGTAVTAALVRDARERGCETATLQSTPMAEGVYAAVGFRDLGRILEYGPPGFTPGPAG